MIVPEHSNKNSINLKPITDYLITIGFIKPTEYLVKISFFYLIAPPPSETIFTSKIFI